MYSVTLSIPHGTAAVYEIKAKNPTAACGFAYMRLLGDVGEREAKNYARCKIEKQLPISARKKAGVLDHYVFPKREPLDWQQIWKDIAARVNERLAPRDSREYLYIHDVAVGACVDRKIDKILREIRILRPTRSRPRDRYVPGDITIHGIPYVPKSKGAANA